MKDFQRVNHGCNLLDSDCRKDIHFIIQEDIQLDKMLDILTILIDSIQPFLHAKQDCSTIKY